MLTSGSYHRCCGLLSICLLATLLATCTPECATAGSFKAAVESIRGKQMRRHVEVLASDTFEGREAGSRGGRAAGVYLVEKLKKLGVQPAGVDGSYYQEFGNGYRNVLATIPGSDPALKHEVIVVCAHYDHVGYGTRQNSLGAIGYIHNGADDNASGTAGLLEIIEAFQQLNAAPKRTVLFAFWDAEEKGLLGCRHWVAHPTLALERIRFALNVDMIGRLRKNRLTIVGARSGYGLRRFLSEQNRDTRLELDFQWTIKRDSDHYPFLQSRVPAIMFHTGKHSDYHTPTDDSHKVNFSDMQRIGRFAFRVARAATRLKRLPKYRPAAWNENDALRRHYDTPLPPEPSRLGITWSEAPDDRGLRIKSVDPGSAAAAAGLRPGDSIEQFNGYRIDGRVDFRTVVIAARNPVAVRLRRPGTAKPLRVGLRLKGDPYRVGVTWDADSAEPECVYLRRVVPGTAAAKAGLKVADRIYAVNGRRVLGSDEFHKLIATEEASLRMTVERAGVIRVVTLRLLGPPKPPPARARKPRSAVAE